MTTSAVGTDPFREGMRRLTGAVCLITTVHDGIRHGLTATAVCSLSAEPPRILACINVTGQTFRLITQGRRMVVNVLGSCHMELAKRFAGMVGNKGDDHFSTARWITAHSGAPILEDALASFDCEVDELFVTRSHGVIIGEIKHVQLGTDAEALLYRAGAFITVPAIC